MYQSNLEKLFYYIRSYNRFINVELVNQDRNYYYISLNGGYLTEININSLNALNDIKLIFKAEDIVNNY